MSLRSGKARGIDRNWTQLSALFWKARGNIAATDIAGARENLEQAAARCRKLGWVADAWIFEALDSELRGEFNGCCEQLEQILKDHANCKLHSHGAYALALVKYKAGQPGEGLPWLEFAERDERLPKGFAYNLRGLIHKELGDRSAAIASFEAASAEPGEHCGSALLNLGTMYRDSEEHDIAIEYYKRALESPGFPGLATAHNNIGASQYELGDYKSAIESLRKSLKEKRGINIPRTIVNVGHCYLKLEEYKKALHWYQKALSDPKLLDQGGALCHAAQANERLGRGGQAIKLFQKSLLASGEGHRGAAYWGFGLQLTKKGQIERAVVQLKRAVAELNREGNDQEAAFVSLLIDALGTKEELRTALDKQLLQSPSGLDPVPGLDELLAKAGRTHEERLLLKLARSRTEYEKYDAKPASGHNFVLSIARGWSSAVPLMGVGGYCRGGGYFLRWGGKGMVVDPGLDFLQNFRFCGFHYSEIDAVVVSHNHSDHNFDLRALDDVMYEMNAAAARLRRAGGKQYRYQLVWDEDTADAYANLNPADAKTLANVKHRLRPLPMNLAMQDVMNVIPLDKQRGLPYTVGYFPVQHSDDVPNAVGLRITCQPVAGRKQVTIGFTCDTGFNEALCAEHALDGCDILIAHISQPSAQEYRDPNFIKKVHLGYRGLGALLKALKHKPRITLVGEFWAGLADLRLDLMHGLRAMTGIQSIFPTSIGMMVRPDTLEIRCTVCSKWTPNTDIRIAPPREPLGPLHYLCNACGL